MRRRTAAWVVALAAAAPTALPAQPPGFERGQVCALDFSAACRIESRPLVETCG